MKPDKEMPLERPCESQILSEVRSARNRDLGGLPPGRRMELAFRLSLDGRKMRIAGLRAQGFSESEIRASFRTGRP